MPLRKNTFHKMVAVIGLLVLPIIMMYSYSNQISIQVVERQLTENSLDKLRFLLNDIEANVEQLSKLTVMLANDPSIKEFIEASKNGERLYSSIKRKMDLMDVLNLFSLTSNWQNSFTLYLPASDEPIGIDNYSTKPFDAAYLKRYASKSWSYIPVETETPDMFVRLFPQPASSMETIERANYILEARFSAKNIISMLNHYQYTSSSDPFLYHPDFAPLLNNKSDKQTVRQLLAQLQPMKLTDHGNITLKLQGSTYLVSYYRSNSLGWYLIDYVPLNEIVSPINKTRNFFYIGITFLLAMSVILTFLLYRNVQVPIRELISSLQKLKRGDYSARLTSNPDNEFSYLFGKFNDMAQQIQELIEKVLAEKLRAKEATLKQLQSQINPHFLYNCLFFIVGMSRLKDHDTVEAMAQNLGDYYKYTTRLENDQVTVEEELQLITNYMEIQNMRMRRLSYEIVVKDRLGETIVPRLLLQPIVENAVVHGIEPKDGRGIVRIEISASNEMLRIEIEDNGVGMTEEAIQLMNQRLLSPISQEMGFALWNVHQRLVTLYGEQSGVKLSRSGLGGLKVELVGVHLSHHQ
ncbi:cache domain-containing sensor histidine kinase [Paenibacillus piri]|uniref:Sensor histidine kinase n=1 Tax=Paenibacillus piri TaxID=2547395 RepID=A0A4V2ZS65_9BACL|nr:histidine kinase [Paenibacillus piri]TDF91984.1 sensor histidine kinase [Paenibacillus piri]